MKRIIIVIIVLTILTGCFQENTVKDDFSYTSLDASIADPVKPATEGWQELFKKQMDSQGSSLQYIWIHDVNADGVPEVFWRADPLVSTNVWYWTDQGGIQSAGGDAYDPATGDLLYKSIGGCTIGSTGNETYEVYWWSEDGYKRITTLHRDSGYFLDDEGKPIVDENGGIIADHNRPCYINDQEVSLQEYEAAYAQYISSRDWEEVGTHLISCQDINFDEYLIGYLK